VTQDLLERLTPCERKVFDLTVREGLCIKEMAQRLGSSPKTVGIHTGRVLRKTGCRTRLLLAVRYLNAELR
jgi:DNA-binding NarL/FixJ family response regulator